MQTTQISQHSPSISKAAYQAPQRPLRCASTIAAAQAVLQTYDLPENIICHLPTHDVRGTRLVSKTWHKLHQQSLAIKRAGCLGPETISKGVPLYGRSAKLVTNPLLYHSHSTSAWTLTNGRFRRQSSHYLSAVALHAAGFHEEFLTMPPIRSIGISHWSRSSSNVIDSASVERDHGLRVKDVREAREAFGRRQFGNWQHDTTMEFLTME